MNFREGGIWTDEDSQGIMRKRFDESEIISLPRSIKVKFSEVWFREKWEFRQQCFIPELHSIHLGGRKH